MEVVESENIGYRTVDKLEEKEQIIRHLYPLLTKTISEISAYRYKIIRNLLGYEKELNHCIYLCNSYFKEVKKSSERRRIRYTMRIHIHSIFKDGSKEPPYPIDITKEEEISNPSKYMIPSSFCVSVEGYLINKIEDERISSKVIDTNSKSNLEEQEWKPKDKKAQMDSGIIETVEPLEDMSSMNINHIKLSSFFSTILIILNEETLIYSKQNNNFHSVDKITFSRIAKNRKNTLIKVVLFPEQEIPVFKLSAPFTDFMNTSEATLPEIVKRICEYSMENGLEGVHEYKTDETLMKLLGVSDFILPELPSLLGKHVSMKAPTILEHLVELEEADESESIYEIELDRVEPCAVEDHSIPQGMNVKENSDKISKILEFIKESEKELEEKEQMRKEPNLEESDVTDIHNRIDADSTKKDILPENVSTTERIQWLKDQGAFALEQIEVIKYDIGEINNEIIEILGEIQKKKNLQLKYEKFVEDPVKFINGLARNINENSRSGKTDLSVLFDDNADFEKYVNSLSTNDYYKNPWINKGIMNYLKVKNKNIEEVARLSKTYNECESNNINRFSNFMEDMNINGGNHLFMDNMNPLLNPMNLMNSMNPMLFMNPMNPMMNMGPMHPMMNTDSLNPLLDTNSANPMNPMMSMDPMNPVNPMIGMDPMNPMNPMMNMNSMNPMNPMMNMNPMLNMNDVDNVNGMYPMMNMNDINKINQMAYMNNMNIENNNENINNAQNANSHMFPDMTKSNIPDNAFMDNTNSFFNNSVNNEININNNNNMNTNIPESFLNSQNIPGDFPNSAMNGLLNQMYMNPPMYNDNGANNINYINVDSSSPNTYQLPMTNVSSEMVQNEIPLEIQKKNSYETIPNSLNSANQPFAYSGNPKVNYNNTTTDK